MKFHRKEIRKDTTIRLRASMGEKNLIEQKAADCGLAVSEYMLRCALGKTVRSKIAATIINELRELTIELKLHREHINPNTETEYGTVLAFIAETISRVPVDETYENF